MPIRQAQTQDLPLIAALAHEALIEIGEYPIEAFISQAIYNYFQKAPCFLLDEDKGFAGLTLTRGFWSEHNIFTDYLFYIRPPFRSLKNIKTLCAAVKDYADEHNMLLRLHFITPNRKEARERLMRVCGFQTTAFIGEYHGKQRK